MAAIFKNKKTGCGCKNSNTDYINVENSGSPLRILAHQCCKTVDLDNIYDDMVVYDQNNTPCEQCLGRGNYMIDCEEDENGNCVDCVALWDGYEYTPCGEDCNSEESSSPHGWVIQDQEVPQCSKLIVFSNVSSDGNNMTYDKISVYKSRKRKSLPFFSKTNQNKIRCNSLPYCQAGNLERECCCGTDEDHARGGTCYTYYKNRGCNVIPKIDPKVPIESLCKNCSSPNFFENLNETSGRFVKKPVYNHWMMSPCSFESQNWPDTQETIQRNIMAYGLDDEDWWFLSTADFEILKQQIAQMDPIGARKHSVLLHCEVRSRPIFCCIRTRDQNYDGVSIGCDGGLGGSYFINKRLGFCGHGDEAYTDNKYNKNYLHNKDDREQKVKIYGVVGFTTACGSFDFEKICDDKWNEGEAYSV